MGLFKKKKVYCKDCLFFSEHECCNAEENEQVVDTYKEVIIQHLSPATLNSHNDCKLFKEDFNNES